MIDYREKGVFPELVRHFLATPAAERECRLWLRDDHTNLPLELRHINLPPDLQSTLGEITNLPQMTSGRLEKFEVNDTTVVQRAHFSYGWRNLPSLQLSFKDADYTGQGWWYQGFIDGLENITNFLKEVAKQKTTVPA